MLALLGDVVIEFLLQPLEIVILDCGDIVLSTRYRDLHTIDNDLLCSHADRHQAR